MNVHVRTRRRNAWALALASVAICAIGTGAYGYWTTRGTGSGTAANTSMLAPTIDPVTVPTTQLRPGRSVNVLVTVRNPNPFPVSIIDVTAGPVTSDHAGCGDATASSGVTLDLAAATGAIPASGSTGLTVPVSMNLTSPQACQGALLSTLLTARVRS